MRLDTNRDDRSALCQSIVKCDFNDNTFIKKVTILTTHSHY